MKKINICIIWAILAFVYGDYVSAAELMLPFEGGKTVLVTQGNNSTPSHSGDWKYSWDFALSEGEPVKAVASGSIVYAGWNNILGNVVIIDFGDNTYGRYCHLLNTTEHPFFLEVGNHVQRG